MAVVVRGGGRDGDAAPGARWRRRAGGAVSQRAPGARRGGGAPVAGPARRRARGARRRPDAELDPERAVDLVLVAARRRATPSGCAGCGGSLRRDELDDGGGRSSDELLAEACSTPSRSPRSGPTRRRPAGVATALAAGSTPRARSATGPRRRARGRPGQRRDGALGDLAGPGWRRPWRAAALARRPARRARRPRPRRRARRCSTPPPRFVDRLPRRGARRLPRAHPGPGRRRRHARRAGAQSGDARRAADARRAPPAASGASSSSPACRRASGPTCGCAARCSARGPRRRRDRPRPVDLAGGAGRGPLRRDPALPRRGHPGRRAAAGHRGAQRGRAALGLPRPRRPAWRRRRLADERAPVHRRRRGR